jgi:hypothetical protein
MDSLGDVRFWSPEEQVIMVAHQAICVADHGVLLESLLELFKEDMPIAVLEKDPVLAVPARIDVINGVRISQSQGPCHGLHRKGRSPGRKILRRGQVLTFNKKGFSSI